MYDWDQPKLTFYTKKHEKHEIIIQQSKFDKSSVVHCARMPVGGWTFHCDERGRSERAKPVPLLICMSGGYSYNDCNARLFDPLSSVILCHLTLEKRQICIGWDWKENIDIWCPLRSAMLNLTTTRVMFLQWSQLLLLCCVFIIQSKHWFLVTFPATLCR